MSSRRYALTPPGWPADRKLTITVIADLHAGGPDMPLPHIRRVVDTANALRSDLIVLLGDFIASYQFKIEARADADLGGGTGAARGAARRLGDPRQSRLVARSRRRARRARATCAFPSWKTTPCCSAPAGQQFWLAGLGDQLAHRLGHGRFRGVDDLPGTLAQIGPTIRWCCWPTSRTSFRACRRASR